MPYWAFSDAVPPAALLNTLKSFQFFSSPGSSTVFRGSFLNDSVYMVHSIRLLRGRILVGVTLTYRAQLHTLWSLFPTEMTFFRIMFQWNHIHIHRIGSAGYGVWVNDPQIETNWLSPFAPFNVLSDFIVVHLLVSHASPFFSFRLIFVFRLE